MTGIPSAKDALIESKRNLESIRRANIETQLAGLHKTILDSIRDGMTYVNIECFYPEEYIYPKNAKILSDLGYKVKPTGHRKYEISWGDDD